jgi:hypothetical protein
MSNKQKHLEFIQTIISRMGNNLFMLKGWTITLIIALFTLSAKDSNTSYIIFSFLVIFIFWILDGYFLSREKCFRSLYNHVRKKKEEKIDFSMDYSKFEKNGNTWVKSIFSKTLIIFYGILLTATILVAIFSNIKGINFIINLKNSSPTQPFMNNSDLKKCHYNNINERNYGKKSFF